MNVSFLGISGGIQSQKSSNVSFVVTEEKISVLAEVSGNSAGSVSACGVDLTELDAVVLSHAHVDHIYALPSLLHNMWLLKRNKPLHVFANISTLDIARTLCAVFGLEKKPGMFRVEWSAFAGQDVHVGPLTIETFPTVHGIPTLGFALSASGRKLAYFADTGPIIDCPSPSMGANAVIHEAGGVESDEIELNISGHCSGRQAALAAARSLQSDHSLPMLFLCHLPPSLAKQAAILSEARFFYSGKTIIPDLLLPYSV